MNKAVYNFPKPTPITCIWIETGNPKQPLTRIWIDMGMTFRNGGREPSTKAEVSGIRLCA